MLVERLIKSGACPRRVMFIPDGLFWGCQPASWTPSSRSLCRRTSWHPTHPWSWESPWSTCPDKTPTQALDMSEDTRHTHLLSHRRHVCVCVLIYLSMSPCPTLKPMLSRTETQTALSWREDVQKWIGSVDEDTSTCVKVWRVLQNGRAEATISEACEKETSGCYCVASWLIRAFTEHTLLSISPLLDCCSLYTCDTISMWRKSNRDSSAIPDNRTKEVTQANVTPSIYII